ncbi:MAG: hypothetical protein ACKO8G_00215 [Actinomycetota bacterium]
MNLGDLIEELRAVVIDAKAMPLSASALINREEVLAIVEDMQRAFPEEIRQARWVVKDREELLQKARLDAEAMLAKAHDEQLRLATREAVVRRAQEEAKRILEEARDDARRIRLEAEDYVDGRLAQFEVALQKVAEDLVATNGALSRTIAQVQMGRDRLRAPAKASEALEPELAPELPTAGPDDRGGFVSFDDFRGEGEG